MPVYPSGTGATIEGPNIIKLNQYLAPQKKRQLNQYVPMESVDPLRFRTNEQEIARKELDGSERILYPFRSNALQDIFPPDPYRVNITGNPSKFGGMTHPIAHRNTGAIDLEDTDFINWKEGIDMSLAPGAEGASAYLSRALHNPPKDGLDASIARSIPPQFDELTYYDDKKGQRRNKRQLLYRDPTTGEKKFVNLPEYPNSIAYLQYQEARQSNRDSFLISRESAIDKAKMRGPTRKFTSRSDLETAFEIDEYDEGNETNETKEGERVPVFDSFESLIDMDNADFENSAPEIIRRQISDSSASDGMRMMVEAGQNLFQSIKDRNYSKAEYRVLMDDLYHIIDQDIYNPGFLHEVIQTEEKHQLAQGMAPTNVKEHLLGYLRLLETYKYLMYEAVADSISQLTYDDNSMTSIAVNEFSGDKDVNINTLDVPQDYDQNGLISTNQNSVSVISSNTYNTNDTGVYGYLPDPSEKLSVQDIPQQLDKDSEKFMTPESKKASTGNLISPDSGKRRRFAEV